MARRRGREERMGGVGHSFVVLPKDKKTGEDMSDQVETEEPKVVTYIRLDTLIIEALFFAGFSLAAALFLGGSIAAALAPLIFVVVVAFLLDKREYFKEDK